MFDFGYRDVGVHFARSPRIESGPTVFPQFGRFAYRLIRVGERLLP